MSKQDPLLPLAVHRVPRKSGEKGEFVVVYYFEGHPDSGLMKEYITLYRWRHINFQVAPRLDVPLDERYPLQTHLNWSALGSVKDDSLLERFSVALQDAIKLKHAIDHGLVVFNPTTEKLEGVDWWSL